MAKKDDYVLLPNESIIMTEGGIYYGGDKANSSNELILTNYNLVLAPFFSLDSLFLLTTLKGLFLC